MFPDGLSWTAVNNTSITLLVVGLCDKTIVCFYLCSLKAKLLHIEKQCLHLSTFPVFVKLFIHSSITLIHFVDGSSLKFFSRGHDVKVLISTKGCKFSHFIFNNTAVEFCYKLSLKIKYKSRIIELILWTAAELYAACIHRHSPLCQVAWAGVWVGLVPAEGEALAGGSCKRL